MKFYLAGKVNPANDWRSEILGGWSPMLYQKRENPFYLLEDAKKHGEAYGEKKLDDLVFDDTRARRACYGGHEYVGPWFLMGNDFKGNPEIGLDDWDHGRASLSEFGGHGIGMQSDRQRIFDSCAADIARCDVFFCWLNDSTAFGTLVEVGMAYALGKIIVIAEQEQKSEIAGWEVVSTATPEDLWFARYCHTFGYQRRFVCHSPMEAYKEFLIRHGADVGLRLNGRP